MSTRSITKITDHTTEPTVELAAFWRHWGGSPTEHGQELVDFIRAHEGDESWSTPELIAAAIVFHFCSGQPLDRFRPLDTSDVYMAQEYTYDVQIHPEGIAVEVSPGESEVLYDWDKYNDKMRR